VAHDFNNVLQVISGNVHLLKRGFATDPKAIKRLNSMMSAVDHGAKLSSQLLAFARRQPLQPIVLNLGRTVRNIDDLLQRALDESVQLSTLVDEDSWNILVDPSPLENVILNLALNARDAMPNGGTLSIKVSNFVVDARHARTHAGVAAGEYVLLAMSDTGAGMSADVMAQAFEPFFTTKPAGKGTGLGLSMAYGFIKQSGGHIEIFSEPGQGTTINILLPRSLEAATSAPVPLNETVVGGNETILVVEDDVEVQASVVGMLVELGYQVLSADDGESALRIIQSGVQIDLLFTDVVMPGSLPGPQLANQAREILPDLKVLFTSGFTRNALISGGRLDDGVQLLSKPYQSEQLAHKIRQMLSSSSRFKSRFTARN
jgi:CheY-like chemotaxis protein